LWITCDTLWEKAYMLVGMENLMIYFLTEPEFARKCSTASWISNSERSSIVAAGVEFAYPATTLGAPRVRSWDLASSEFLAPEYHRLVGLYKEHGVRIGFHSCGDIASVLDLFLELGIDVLNPVQATANDLDRVRSITQGRMALAGGVSSATVMDGPIDRITAEVKQRIKQLGWKGGYFCHPDQDLPFPKDHLEAFYSAVERYGIYH
jgi:uroporphyrinogen decarboxylase